MSQWNSAPASLRGESGPLSLRPGHVRTGGTGYDSGRLSADARLFGKKHYFLSKAKQIEEKGLNHHGSRFIALRSPGLTVRRGEGHGPACSAACRPTVNREHL